MAMSESEYQAVTSSATGIWRGQEKAPLTSHIASFHSNAAPKKHDWVFGVLLDIN
jgi:hypothetical protein